MSCDGLVSASSARVDAKSERSEKVPAEWETSAPEKVPAEWETSARFGKGASRVGDECSILYRNGDVEPEKVPAEWETSARFCIEEADVERRIAYRVADVSDSILTWGETAVNRGRERRL